jgi:hypothetical protein
MIFLIQRYLEDYFHKRNLRDADQYAVTLANLYARKRGAERVAGMLQSMRRVQTVFYKNNTEIERVPTEKEILRRLDAKFQKKSLGSVDVRFPGGVSAERAKLRRLPRRSIRAVLESFKHAVEARAVDTIWKSRQAAKLRRRPEKVAQGLLALFVMGVLSDRGGQLLREFASGVGFIDFEVLFGRTRHLIEMKVLRSAFSGVAQLQTYMKTEKRSEGWLVVVETRAHNKRTDVPSTIRTTAGIVRVVVVDVNPLAPSKQKEAS